MSGQSSGFISGAASGAAAGASFGPWGAVIGGVAGGVLGMAQGAAQDKEFASQQAWADYNNQSQYNISMSNIGMQSMLTQFNASLMIDASNRVLENAGQQAGMTRDIAAYNVGLLSATTAYNDSLLEDDIDILWENMELDLTQLANQRAIERGDIIAEQAASGTVIGMGSNADVIVDSKTQEAMDAFIVRRGADINVRDINNARAQGAWEGMVSVQQTLWNGEIAAYTTLQNAQAQAEGMRMQAASGLLEGAIGAWSGQKSAEFALQSGIQGISQGSNLYNSQNRSNMMSSLFGAAGAFGTSYYKSKAISPNVQDAGGTLYSSAAKTNYQRAMTGSPSWERGLTVPGSSLAT